MKKALVAYFSASGVTRKVAENIAKAAGADLFEIRPKVAYTKEDLNWTDKNSRSTVEMKNTTFRPPVEEKVKDMSQYDTVMIGFPIWWYTAPTIIHTFLESYDFSGKKIALFATSGGSGLGKTSEKLRSSVDASAEFISEKLLNRASEKDIQEWLKRL